ncbi:MAG: DUF3604 domain-containing protein [Pseudomonadota bacterium]
MKVKTIALIVLTGVVGVSAVVLIPQLGLLQTLGEVDDMLSDSANPLADVRNSVISVNDAVIEGAGPKDTAGVPTNPERNAYFGDLHVHTALSFDAYVFGTTTTPRDAYRFALGETIKHPLGYDMKLRRPLDFYAVTDHAMFLGVVQAASDPANPLSQEDFARYLAPLNADASSMFHEQMNRYLAFGRTLPALIEGVVSGDVEEEDLASVVRTAWVDSVKAADEYYEPGVLTTFAAYEFTTSSDDQGNLHRNVIFKDTARLPAEPFSRFHSRNPEGLWDWMDGLREDGIEALAIPHNSNGSNGNMFMLTDWQGAAINDEYAQQRLRNEPLVEVTQVKGTSETHPALSPNDEWADFEIARYRVATNLESKPNGSYVRDAYARGLSLARQGITNPYEFGLIGSSDTHVVAGSFREEIYHGKVGLMDATANDRGSLPLEGIPRTVARIFPGTMSAKIGGDLYVAGTGYEEWGASGLAAVWAESNTREAIYEAMRRKETFATSGPRMKVRFFATGDAWSETILSTPSAWSLAYDLGVPMGGRLSLASEEKPEFLVMAEQDPLSAPLQRVQIIKASVTANGPSEMVFDAACSDGAVPDPDTHRCPDNGATVDLSDCSISGDSGAATLSSVWSDPTFEAGQEAVYYVRVLENPTCRWSTWDAVREGLPPREDLKTTIQERAWSSPIWVGSREI